MAVCATAVALMIAGCGDNGGPTADAGADFSVSVGDVPSFDGCASTGDIENYQWTIVRGPDEADAGKLLRETMSDCAFELESSMVIDDVGEWTIELSVTDGSASSTDQVVVQVVE